MVGDPTHASAVIVPWHILLVTHLSHSLNEWPKNIDVEVAVDALQHRAGAFEAHACVDVAARERTQVVRQRADTIELRKYKVPDFDIAAIGHPVENLTAGSAHAVWPLGRGACRPKIIVFAHASDLRCRQAHFVRPDGVGLAVVLIDSDGKFVGGDIEPRSAGQEFPRPKDCLPLEVVAKAKVTQHLKERVVPRGAAHVVDVSCAKAFLARGGLCEFQFTFAEEVILELVHARRCEEHRRIPPWHEHIAGAADAPLRLEER